jgi:hypothetical protein
LEDSGITQNQAVMCVAGGYYSIPLVPPRQYPGLPGLGLRSVGTPRRISESIGPGPGPARRASAAQAGPSSVFWPGDRSGFYIDIAFFFCWFQSTSSAHRPHRRRAGTEWQQGCPKGWDVDAQPTEICAPWGALLAAPALTRSFLLQSASACTAKMGTLLVAVVVSLPACSGHVHRPASVATRVGTGSRVSGKGRGALTICYIRPGPDCVVLPCIDSRRSGLRQQQKLRRIRLRQQQKLRRIRCMLLFHVALSAFLMQRLCVVRFRLQRAPC